MARLFSLMNAGAIDDPVLGHIEPSPDHGGFDLPAEAAGRLLAMHLGGKPMWEDELGRQARLGAEDTARRRSPEALHDGVMQLVDMLRSLAGGANPQPGPEPAKGQSRRGTAKKADPRPPAPPAEGTGSDNQTGGTE